MYRPTLEHVISYSSDTSFFLCNILLFSTTYTFQYTSQRFRLYSVNTFGRIILEIRGNISFFKLTIIGSVVTSSQCCDEALSAKIYPTHICQLPGLAVIRLIEIWKSVYWNQPRWLFSINNEKCLAFHRICKTVPACNTYRFTSKPQNIPHPWPAVYIIVYIPTRICYRGVLGFATDCPCGVWCRGLTTCLLYVGPLFGNLVENDSRFVSLT